MVNLLLENDRESLTRQGTYARSTTRPAAPGMLSIAEEYIRELNPDATPKVFGQEINPESYAICKSDMLIKGQDPGNIKFGNTFTVDGFSGEHFDYMLSNPPFGVDWKKAQRIIKQEHDKLGYEGRFGPGLPRINDGALLFLLHMISKMWQNGEGSRIAIVFNGSPLFTGGAGSGESEIRKWIIENDWLEAIVALPDQMFYNTGISTYIWLLSNRKSPQRKGKIQLIDATGSKDGENGRENRFWLKMSRSLGNKRKEIGDGREGKPDQIGFITRLYGEFREGEFCKIFPNEFFGYQRITVEQPERDEAGQIVRDRQGQPKADSSLRDYENIPLIQQEDGKWVAQDIEAYFETEVRPHLPEAWIDHGKTKTGYEINFSKYFYEFKPLRSLAEIRADILRLEQETEGLIRKVIEE